MNTSSLQEVDSSTQEDSSKKPTIIPSEKNYILAVCLCGIFGVLGIHHFYLGRYLEGFIDLSLAILTIVLYLLGEPVWAFLVFAIDGLHSFIVTIMLLTGSVKDGKGHLVCYPGQRLR